MGKAFRKPRPSPPKHVWLDVDGCWFCDNKRNCNQCKMLKQWKKSRQKQKDESWKKGEDY